jgi:predicted dehydrogenase
MTMQRLPIAIVGCGGMGGRHLRGLKELSGTPFYNVELVAVCDLRLDNAEHLAGLAEELLGARPQVFQSMEAMVAALPELQGVDVTTDSGSHHAVATEAFGLGLHVFLEKPIALSMRGSNQILAAQQRAGKALSVAEQFRRDPICRLTKALIEAGVIGELYALFEIGGGSGDQIIILPWRHYKQHGGILVDAGVHTSDLMQTYMGPAREVYAHTRLFEPVRRKGRLGVAHFYEHWYDEVPETIEATAEDTVLCLITFENGAMGQWTSFRAAHGRPFDLSGIYGRLGSLHSPGARNGRPVTVHLDKGGQLPGGRELVGDAVLDLVPEFHLDPVTAHLFQADRLGSYNYTFPEADRKLLALEYWEFGACMATGQVPEVDGLVARKALALVNAALESAVLHRPVTLAEIEAEETGEYEREINEHWGI